MKLFWLNHAQKNLHEAITYIAQVNPRAALDQLNKIEIKADKLAEFPMMGRIGRVEGTRELVVTQTPFMIVYRINSAANRLEILRILHGAEQWPKQPL